MAIELCFLQLVSLLSRRAHGWHVSGHGHMKMCTLAHKGEVRRLQLAKTEVLLWWYSTALPPCAGLPFLFLFPPIHDCNMGKAPQVTSCSTRSSGPYSHLQFPSYLRNRCLNNYPYFQELESVEALLSCTVVFFSVTFWVIIFQPLLSVCQEFLTISNGMNTFCPIVLRIYLLILSPILKNLILPPILKSKML